MYIHSYLTQITQTTARGDAREESYYPTLAAFFEQTGQRLGKPKTQITTLPKQTEAGNPDFRIWDGSENIVGYIEAKKPGENLDVVERSNQLKRYRSVFPNLILTDFYEFRLYRNGELLDKTFVARAALAKKGIPPPVENEEAFESLLQKFFSFSLPRLSTAGQLARELALRTRFLRDEVIAIELEQQQKGKGELYGFYDTFKRFLIANLKEKDFADLFSQTITYGLFAARTRSENGFNRKLAYDLIPKTIGILRNIFKFVSQGDLPRHMEVMVDDIAEVLNAADVKNILHQYYKAGKGEDPIVHFYETFLSEYDPATREKRGVYYTPEPVVRYIVRSIHSLLQSHFDCPDGLADKGVTVLDPAGGTLTFPAEAIKLAVQHYSDLYGEGAVDKLISNHILKNFYAFELMMAPYAIGHIKISFLLEELGYTMKENERFKLYLTNTLDMEDLAQTQIPGLESLSEESQQAGRVKKSEPILVIMGNPPYSGISANINDWTEKLLKTNLDGAQSYYMVDGKPLGEKKLWLQNDYVKFLRFAQWKIQKAGEGIVGMITDNSYLDNPTFRGMRQSLMQTYNEIYIVDLHGNSNKKEVSPDGKRDQNVFEILQGVSIAIFVKKRKAKGCTVRQIDLFGDRQLKYDWLEEHSLENSSFEKLNPESPWYFMIPHRTQDINYFLDWLKIDEIFPINSVGIVTARDGFAIDFDRQPLEGRIRQFKDLRFDDEFLKSAYGLKDTSTFKLSRFRLGLSKEINWENAFEELMYRPFDCRQIFYSDWVVERRVFEVMQHMLKPNIGLALTKRIEIGSGFEHVFIADKPITHHTVSLKEVNYLFPLYLYPSENPKKKSTGFTMLLFEPEPEYGGPKRTPNLSPIAQDYLRNFFPELSSLPLGEGWGGAAEHLLQYCYAVLYCNTYREKYAEFLKIDFPRIPFTSDKELFLEMAALGKQLIQLHLLKANPKPVVKYLGKGEGIIEKPYYDGEKHRVYLSSPLGSPGGAVLYFEGISPAMWNYHIGGYQVLEKYLKDRKGRQMDDPATYCRIATAIAETIKIQNLLEPVFDKIEQNVLA